MEFNGESLASQLKKLMLGTLLGVTDRDGIDVAEVYEADQFLSSQIASVGRPSFRPPHINKRVDSPHSYHLVIENAWDLHAIVKGGLSFHPQRSQWEHTH
eukprot:12890780-Prorocentrum_lima.AAC.1